MYKSHFGLIQDPFGVTPNTDFVLKTKSYQEAFDTLSTAVQNGAGFAKITGEVGTGKTLLCRKFIASLGPEYVTAYIHNPYLEPQTLLLALADELSIPLSGTDATNQHQLLKLLSKALSDIAAQGKRAVLCIDEAQAMPLVSLEALRLLTNLETEKHKLLQVILFGQPELDEKLHQNSVRQLLQRIIYQYQAKPLAYDEIIHYLAHRLSVAGYQGGGLFSTESVPILYRATQGVQRLVNILAHKALLLAHTDNSRTVEKRHILAAVRDTPAAKRTVFPTLHIVREGDTATIFLIKQGLVLVAGLLVVLILGWGVHSLLTQPPPQAVQTSFPTASAPPNHTAPDLEKGVDASPQPTGVSPLLAPAKQNAPEITPVGNAPAKQNAPEVTSVGNTPARQNTAAVTSVENAPAKQNAPKIASLGNTPARQNAAEVTSVGNAPAKQNAPEVTSVGKPENAELPNHKPAVVSTSKPDPLATSKDKPKSIPGNASQNSDTTLSTFEKLLSVPHATEDEYATALFALQQGRPAEAKEKLLQILKKNPHHYNARLALANLALDQNDQSGAEQVLREGVQLDPKSPVLAFPLARLVVERGNPGESLEILRTASAEAGEDPHYHAFMGALAQRMGDHRSAIEQYRTALRRAPHNAIWLMGLGISLATEHQNKEARQVFHVALNSRDLSTELHAYVEQQMRALGEEVATNQDPVQQTPVQSAPIRLPTELPPFEATQSTPAQPVPLRSQTIPHAHRYMLHVGTFRDPREADQLRTRLSVMGFAAKIQTVIHRGRSGVFHKVRLGPFHELDETSTVQQRLQAEGIPCTLSKNKAPGN